MVVWGAMGLSILACPAGAWHPDMQWYLDASYLIHFDWHAGPGLTSDGATPEHIAQRLRLSRPDAIAMHSMGHPGWTTYPTDVDARLRTPTLEGDVFGAYAEACKLADCRFQAYISSLWNGRAGELHPEWQTRDHDGKYYHTGWMCHNGPFVDEILFPQIKEILERYEPAGWWFDGEFVQRPCWCDHCQRKWQEKHGAAYPEKMTEETKVALWHFVWETYAEYIERLSELIHSIRPGSMYCKPGTGDPRFIWPVAQHMDNLSTHLPLPHGARHSGPFSRSMTSWDKPFDIMICNHTSIPGQGWLFKTPEDLLQQAAVCAANGARVSQWDNPTGEGSLLEYPHAVLGKALGEFLRARRPWTVPTKSVPYVAALHSWHHFYRNGTGGTTHDIYAVHDALVEEQYHLDIIPEHVLLERLPEYRVLIMACQTHLPEEVYGKVREYVRGGGGLVVTGEVDVVGEGDERELALADVLGVELLPSGAEAGSITHAGHSFELSECLPVKTTTAEVICPLEAGPGALDDTPAQPAVTLNRFGRGRALFIAAPLFRQFGHARDPRRREFLDSCVSRVIDSKMVEVEGPSCVQVSLRRKGEQTIVHLCNNAPGKDLHGGDLIVERVPTIEMVRVRLECPRKPEKVRLQPEDREPVWGWEKGRLQVEVPDLHIHTAVVVE